MINKLKPNKSIQNKVGLLLSIQMMYKYLLLILFPIVAHAQDLAYFSDKLNRFWAFDAGIFHKLEHLPVKNVQLGGNFLIYEDQLSQVQEYRNGKKTILNYMPLSHYFQLRRYFMAADIQGILRLYYDGKTESLTPTQNIADVYAYSLEQSLGDSILAFVDFDRQLKAYYQGEKYDLNNQQTLQYRLQGDLYSQLPKHKVSSNSVAYLTENETFNVFYKRESKEVESTFPNDYQVGNNALVAYLNRFNELWLFENGKNKQLSTVKPKKWQLGTDMLVWINENDLFKCHYKGNTQELLPLAPTFFQLKDSLLTYTDERGFFNAFYQGKNYVLETYLPTKILQNGAIAAYLDLNGRVKAFYEGEQVAVSKELVNDFTIMGKCIVYTINQYGNNTGDTQIYWNKKTFIP